MTIESSFQSAFDLWESGVNAVLPQNIIRRYLRLEPDSTPQSFFVTFSSPDSRTAPLRWRLSPQGRVIIVGFGKASGAMADACEELFAPLLANNRLLGWVNVPDDQVRTNRPIYRHGGRPAGCNEPTEAGVEGTKRIVSLLQEANEEDILIALVSGGGSALLPLPIPEMTLAQKGAVTRFLSGAGANIIELNTVRGALSQVKSGGLLRLARSRRFASLLISDVLGSPLSIIAGGATVPATQSLSAAAWKALDILHRFGAEKLPDLLPILEILQNRAERNDLFSPSQEAHSFILADNSSAVEAAAKRGRELGYQVEKESAPTSEGKAEEVGRALLQRFRATLRSTSEPRLLISGGEPVVELVPAPKRGRGGRNTQMVLAALHEVLRNPAPEDSRILFLSAGTDGEDGPTTAAGAYFDVEIVARARALETRGVFPEDYLRRNDAYTYFERCGGLITTGPTGTNVCDLRILLAR